MNREEIMARIGVARSRRYNYERGVQEISDLCMPYRGDITRQKAQGQDRTLPAGGVFDSTGILAQDTFVNFLKSTIFPSTQDWLRLSLTGEVDSEASAIADVVATRIMEQTHHSNFYNVVDSWVRDMAVLGTGTLFVEENPWVGDQWGGFNFTPIPWGKWWFMTDAHGNVIFGFREEEMPVIAAYRKWGTAGHAGNQKLEEGGPMEVHKYIHVCWMNEKGIPGGLEHPEDKPYVTHWLTEEGDDGPEILETNGHDLNPYITGRWMCVDGEDYGRGQGHIARPDLKGVNKLKELTLDAAGVDLKPPFLVEDETAIDLDLGPSGLVVVRGGHRVNPQFLATGSRYDLADNIGRQDREAIRKAFLMDLIDDPEFQDRSAEAVRDRQNKAAQRLAPRADKVYSEMLYPLVAVMANRMVEAGQLPELEQLSDDFGAMNVNFVSPFFTAQKEAPAIRLNGWLENIKRNAVEMQRPDMLDFVDLDEFVKCTADMGDIPGKILRTQADVDQLREQRAQAIQQQQQLDQAQQLAQIEGSNEQGAGVG